MIILREFLGLLRGCLAQVSRPPLLLHLGNLVLLTSALFCAFALSREYTSSRYQNNAERLLWLRIRGSCGLWASQGFDAAEARGWQIWKSLVHQLYGEEGLTLRHKPRRRRCAATNHRERVKLTAPNEVWSLDFVADQLADGRRFGALTVVDVFTREVWPSRWGKPERRGCRGRAK